MQDVFSALNLSSIVFINTPIINWIIIHNLNLFVDGWSDVMIRVFLSDILQSIRNSFFDECRIHKPVGGHHRMRTSHPGFVQIHWQDEHQIHRTSSIATCWKSRIDWWAFDHIILTNQFVSFQSPSQRYKAEEHKLCVRCEFLLPIFIVSCREIIIYL